jgi:hypothetical protein
LALPGATVVGPAVVVVVVIVSVVWAIAVPPSIRAAAKRANFIKTAPCRAAREGRRSGSTTSPRGFFSQCRSNALPAEVSPAKRLRPVVGRLFLNLLENLRVYPYDKE